MGPLTVSRLSESALSREISDSKSRETAFADSHLVDRFWSMQGRICFSSFGFERGTFRVEMHSANGQTNLGKSCHDSLENGFFEAETARIGKNLAFLCFFWLCYRLKFAGCGI